MPDRGSSASGGAEEPGDAVPGLPLSWALPLVSAGAIVGALARYGLAEAIAGPWHTLLTNLSGCLLLGLLVGARRDDLALRAFAGTGVLGGFTTMSTFAVETDRLAPGAAVAYAAATVLGGLALAAAGLALARRAGR